MALGGWDTVNSVCPFTVNTINSLSTPMIYLYEKLNARVKKIFKPGGSIVFLCQNAKCCETKWAASFSSNVNIFASTFTGPVVPHTKQTAHVLNKNPAV